MSKFELLKVILKQRCTTAAAEIFRAVAKTLSKYQDKVYLSKEENDRLQRLFDIILKPEIKLYRTDFQQFIVSEEELSPVQQHCKQNWSPSLGQNDWNPIQIKEEHEERRIIQVNEDSVFTPAWVKIYYDHYTTLHKSSSQIQSEEYIDKTASTEQIKTEPKEEDSSEPTSESQPLRISKRTLTEKDTLSSKVRKSMDLKSPVHRRSYTEMREKPFCCSDCGERFTLMGKLNSHRIMMHSGKNPYRFQPS
ncbi:uncharacterized protein LOC115195174 [Salmo trutta]|uniref:uncharacterized protein LOC115195174 n=1 Tax=Salmo trutta TaxID=8032 RepID=UPI001130E0D6|nr:uncharacterized protein LOC115195174 [Salmo trutta]